MNEDLQKKLDAYFDGELSPPETEGLKRQIAANPEAQAYLACLEKTRQALACAHVGNEHEVPVWELVKKQRGTRPATARYAPRSPAAVFAVLTVLFAGMAIWIPFRKAGQEVNLPAPNPEFVNAVEIVETDLENATPIVFLDEPSGWTVVWVLEDDPTGEI